MGNYVLLNIAKQAFNLKRFPVLIRKALQRLTDKKQDEYNQVNLQWLSEQKQDYAEYAKSLDSVLWDEALAYAQDLESHADNVLGQLDVTLGGGGFYPLIYFVTRYTKPKTVVETGVAAGYSSHAFLSALEKNKQGKLFSSDFPYFRLKNPQRYIGILVPETLKPRWQLFIDGDTRNLPLILERVEQIDLFHYDSDKRYAGRQQAMDLISAKLSPNAVIIMDDINDNAFFMEMCQSASQSFRIFKFGGKYIGLLGDFQKINKDN